MKSPLRYINSLSFNSTQRISTLSNTQSLKNVFLSGRAFPYRPLQVVFPGFKTTFPYFQVMNSPNQVSLTRSVSFKLWNTAFPVCWKILSATLACVPPATNPRKGGGVGWGYYTKFYTGRFRPEVRPLTLVYTLTEKEPFPITSIGAYWQMVPLSLTSFRTLIYIPFHRCWCTVVKVWPNKKR